MENILSHFTNNPVEYTFAYVVIVISVWLFVNISRRIEKFELKEIDRNDIFLTKCSRLLFLLKSLKNSDNISIDIKNDIDQTISEMVPYTSEKFMESLLSWENNKDELINKIKNKLTIIKKEQRQFIFKDDLTVSNLFGKGFFISGLSNYLKSIFFLFIILVFLMVLFRMMLESYINGNINALLFVSPFLCYVLAVINFWKVYDTHQITKKKNFKNIGWFILYSLIVLIGVITIIMYARLDNKLVTVIGSFIYLILYIYIFDIVKCFKK